MVNPESFVLQLTTGGMVHRLRDYLDQLSKEEVNKCINCRTEGTTPLILACRNGFTEIVTYLVLDAGADVELTGVVTFDGETVEGAPPLWCAAAAGHITIVQLLVYAGANINATTQTNSTPLRAACFDGHIGIVKFLTRRGADIEIANRHGHTCLMIACYKGHYDLADFLIKLGADINRKSIKGNTALHDCAESGNKNVLELLLKHGAVMDTDSYSMTPLLAASVTGHANIVDHIINNYGKVNRHTIIDALELLGATYVDKKRDLHTALNLWRKAMNIRFDPKYPVITKLKTEKRIKAYNYAMEVQHIDELNELIDEPDKMRMQALLIRERILGPAHPDTIYYIRYRGAVYADSGRFSRCIALWKYALDMQISILEPLNLMTQSSFYSFTELFSLMVSSELCNSYSSNGKKFARVGYNEIMCILKKAIAEVIAGFKLKDKPGFEESVLQRVVIISLHLLSLLSRMIEFLPKDEVHDAHVVLYNYLKENVTVSNNSTLLHLACNHKHLIIHRYPLCIFPNSELIRLLCEAGADVNARDDDGNTALHLIASHPYCSEELPKILLQYGSHIDSINKKKQSFLTLNLRLCNAINKVQHTTLACTAAAVIKKHAIPYKDVIPVHLHSFIEDH